MYLIGISSILFFGQTALSHEKSDSSETPASEPGTYFQRRWVHVSENSAVIYWQADDISKEATGFVEYGTTEELGMQTAETKKPRNAQFHRLKGLDPGVTYFYKMVATDPAVGTRTESELMQLTTSLKEGTLYIPRDLTGTPPYMLGKTNGHYVLTQDFIANGTAFIIEGSGITLDLNGHTVIFGNNTTAQVFGIQVTNGDTCKVMNGIIIQGERSAEYSNAVRSFRSGNRGVEICGISTDVHLKNAQPMVFRHDNLKIHHNDIYSRVIDLESRHYPGNVLLRVEANGKNVHLHDNLLTEGCHRAILVSSTTSLTNVEIEFNDIQHHQQYVNGYAIAPGSDAKVHHNRITSTGRGIHITGANTELYNNYIDIRGHQHLDDLPAGSRPFLHHLIELHGIKLEGTNARNNKIYNNFVRITQLQPFDSEGRGEPEDKKDNGVYFRANASSIENGKLVDLQQNWEADRWQHYFVKYDENKPAVKITGNDATTLYGDFSEGQGSGEYTVYMIWNYVPPTPLNISCYDPNGMNEIYNNTFIGLTTYDVTRHGGYGDTGQWATSVMFVGMDKGAAEPGKYSVNLYNNQFFSNDLFVNSSSAINMDILSDNNTFSLTNEPFTTERTARIRNIGTVFEEELRNGSNIFNEEISGLELYNSDGLFVYPNPVSSKLVLKGFGGVSSGCRVIIYAADGKKFYESPANIFAPFEVDVSHLPRGFYIVSVMNGDEKFTQKIFKN